MYKDAEVPRNWTTELKEYCEKIDVTFFTTPYDLDTVDFINPYVPAFKIGSGDVAWHAMLKKIASTASSVRSKKMDRMQLWTGSAKTRFRRFW